MPYDICMISSAGSKGRRSRYNEIVYCVMNRNNAFAKGGEPNYFPNFQNVRNVKMQYNQFGSKIFPNYRYSRTYEVKIGEPPTEKPH